MLHIVVPGRELFDESTESFITVKEQALKLEHSLISISKWESKWNKAFLGKEPKTPEETRDYVRCMTITQNVPDAVYNNLTNENLKAINEYIEAPMTATVLFEDKSKGHVQETITSELIYYWMIALQIPVEFQTWHLNRLITLIRVCNIKNSPPKKMSKNELANRNAKLNAARKAKFGTHG